MVFDIKLQDITHHALDLLNPRIAELHYFTAINTDNMIVLFIPVRFLELGHVFAELMFSHQIARYQQFQRIIYRSAANTVFLILHVDIQRFHIKVIGARIYLFQNGKALRCFPKTFIFKLSLENLFYHCYGFQLGHSVLLKIKVINYLGETRTKS